MDDRRQDAEHPGDRYETRDVQVRPIAIFTVGLIILTITVLLLLRWMFDVLETRHARFDVPRSPLVISPPPLPEPRLEVIPEQILRQLRAEEDAVLHSYGWVNRDTGVVRIPIDRAMLLLMERGLPARTEDRTLRTNDGAKKTEP
jgi:hypothetical protein